MSDIYKSISKKWQKRWFLALRTIILCESLCGLVCGLVCGSVNRSTNFLVHTLWHVHEFVNSIDFLNISLWFLGWEVTTLYVVQALCAWSSEP